MKDILLKELDDLGVSLSYDENELNQNNPIKIEFNQESEDVEKIKWILSSPYLNEITKSEWDSIANLVIPDEEED